MSSGIVVSILLRGSDSRSRGKGRKRFEQINLDVLDGSSLWPVVRTVVSGVPLDGLVCGCWFCKQLKYFVATWIYLHAHVQEQSI